MDQKVIDYIGKDTYIALLKKHNLTTKKWTLSRTKEFYREIDLLINKRNKYYEKLFDLERKYSIHSLYNHKIRALYYKLKIKRHEKKEGV